MTGDAWSVVLRAQWGRPPPVRLFVNNSSQQQQSYSRNNILDKSAVAYVNFYQKLYEKIPSLCLFSLFHSPCIHTHAFYQSKTVSKIHPRLCCTNINIILSSLQNVQHKINTNSIYLRKSVIHRTCIHIQLLNVLYGITRWSWAISLQI